MCPPGSPGRPVVLAYVLSTSADMCEGHVAVQGREAEPDPVQLVGALVAQVGPGTFRVEVLHPEAWVAPEIGVVSQLLVERPVHEGPTTGVGRQHDQQVYVGDVCQLESASMGHLGTVVGAGAEVPDLVSPARASLVQSKRQGCGQGLVVTDPRAVDGGSAEEEDAGGRFRFLQAPLLAAGALGIDGDRAFLFQHGHHHAFGAGYQPEHQIRIVHRLVQVGTSTLVVQLLDHLVPVHAGQADADFHQKQSHQQGCQDQEQAMNDVAHGAGG